MKYTIQNKTYYRTLEVDEKPQSGESSFTYVAFYHPKKERFTRRIAILNGSNYVLLQLINIWNNQPESGWSYFSNS